MDDARRNHTPESDAAVPPTTFAGDGMLHPAAWLPALAMALNDHWGKRHLPPWLGGKGSDLAGMMFFPLLLVAAWELLCALRIRSPVAPSRRALAAAVIATGIVFTLVKTTVAFHDLYALTWGAMRWLVSWLVALARSTPSPPFQRVSCVRDPTDLLALVALIVPWRVGLRRTQSFD